MSEKGKLPNEQAQSKNCFVIMPISDTDGYDEGHFDRVYDFIIRPACEKAGYVATRADKTNNANYIVIDILKQIINSDMAICDLSSRNSNVFFELGLRQAFNLKTVLIKDTKTPRSFDIAGLRCIDYDNSLRVDNVEKIVDQLAAALKETTDSKKEDVNSLIQLLAVDAAKLPEKVVLSDDTGVILREIQRLRDDVNLKAITHRELWKQSEGVRVVSLPNGELVPLGTKLYKISDSPFYDEYGVLEDRRPGLSIVRRKDGVSFIKDEDIIWRELTTKESVF
jgi:hypothetical protein